MYAIAELGAPPAWTLIDTLNDADEKAVVAVVAAYRGIDPPRVAR